MKNGSKIQEAWKVADESQLNPVIIRLADTLKTYRLLLLDGDLGAGKTTTVRHLLKQMGTTDEVSSPSYSLINEYMTTHEKRMYHMDMYRISSIEEALSIGIEEYLYGEDICLIEWADLIVELVDEPYLRLNIRRDDQGVRIFTLTSSD